MDAQGDHWRGVDSLVGTLSCLRIQGRDALPRVRNGETQHGRGAPRPYQIGFVRKAEFFYSSPLPMGLNSRRAYLTWAN